MRMHADRKNMDIHMHVEMYINSHLSHSTVEQWCKDAIGQQHIWGTFCTVHLTYLLCHVHLCAVHHNIDRDRKSAIETSGESIIRVMNSIKDSIICPYM